MMSSSFPSAATVRVESEVRIFSSPTAAPAPLVMVAGPLDDPVVVDVLCISWVP